MPESVDQPVPTPPKESSPVSRIIARIKNTIHAHTPEGRREEYREKWNHVLENVNGLPRFELERRLHTEADKYARDRVIRDVLVVTAVTGGALVGTLGLRELRKQNWDLKGLFQSLGATIRTNAESAVDKTMEVVVTGVMKGAGKAVEQHPNLVTDLAARAAEQAMNGIQTRLKDDPSLVTNIVDTATKQASDAIRAAAASNVVQDNLASAGAEAVGAFADGAAAEIAARASALPHQTEAVKQSLIAKLLGLFIPKK